VRFERNRVLTWEQLNELPTRRIEILGEDWETTRDLVIAGVLAVQVPTRMHDPGWYLRSPAGALEWSLRSEGDLNFVRLLCAAGAIRLPARTAEGEPVDPDDENLGDEDDEDAG
jgi:hypothetical protein